MQQCGVYNMNQSELDFSDSLKKNTISNQMLQFSQNDMVVAESWN